MRRLLPALALLLIPSVAWAQGAVSKCGSSTSGHIAMWSASNCLVDAGGITSANTTPANSNLPGTLPSGMAMVNGGQGLALYSGYTTGSYSRFLIGFDGSGNPLMTLDSVGGSDVSPTVSINGTTYPFFGTGNGDVVGPASATSGHAALYNGTTGQLLKDGTMTGQAIDSSTLTGAMVLGGDTTWTRNIGVANNGTTQSVLWSYNFSGNNDASSDVRGTSLTMTATGTNSIANMAASITSAEVFTTGGTTTSAYAHQDHVRLGQAGLYTGGTLSVASVFNGHIANEGNAALTNAWVFSAGGIDLVDGSGTVANSFGFYSGDQGHATRITNKAAGFGVADMTGGAPITAGFYSEMANGTGKWGAYMGGSADNLLKGNTMIGTIAVPTVPLQVRLGSAGTSLAASIENNGITAATNGVSLMFGLSRTGTPIAASGGEISSIAEGDYSTGAESKASLVFDIYNNGVSTAFRVYADKHAVFQDYLDAIGGFRVDGAAGLSKTCTVNQAATLIFTLGLLTGGTCAS